MPQIQHPRQTFGYCLLLVGIGLDAAIIGPTLPSLAGQVGVSLASISGILVAASVGYTLGTLLGGWLFDRFRGHIVLGIAALLLAATVGLVPMASSLPALLAVLAAKGLAGGVINTGSNTLILWLHGERSSPYMNALHLSFGVGAFLSPFLVAGLISRGNAYREAYWLLAAVSAAIGLHALVMPGSPTPRRHSPGQTGRRAIPRAYWPVLVSAMLFLFFYVGAELTIADWIYTYTTRLGLADAVGAAYLNSGFWLSFTIGRVLAVAVATRVRPERVIPASLVGAILMLGVVLAFPGSSRLLWAAVIGLGLFMAPIFANGLTLAGRMIPLSATLTSLILLGDSLGGMALPWLSGQVIDRLGPRAILWLVLGSLALNLAAYVALIRSRPPARSGEPSSANG